jgi:hypothetical protein
MISPGEIGPLWKLAAFTTAVTVGRGKEGAEMSIATEIDWELSGTPGELIVMLPVYVPVPSPTGLTETLRFAGVVPVFGATESQLPPDVVVAEALKLKAIPLLPKDKL